MSVNKCPKTVSGEHYFKRQRSDLMDKSAFPFYMPRERNSDDHYERYCVFCGLVDDTKIT